MNKQKYTVEEFIRIANEVHNNKYDYSHIEYRGLKHKIKVICHEKDINGVEHGMYYITTHNHLKKDGCPKCSTRKPLNTEEFIKRANDIHDGKYGYSKVEYVNNKTKICIICPEHGEFWQTPHAHLQGCNCFKCSRNIIGFNKRLTQEQFISRVKEIHGNKYDYSKVNYINSQTKVCIICPIHGEFWQKPDAHLQGKGCQKCSGNEFIGTEKFVERAKIVHGDKYNYSKVEYVSNNAKVCIICPEHGEFWQTPHHHLSGQGCCVCNQSHLEREMMMFLQEHNIRFEEQKTFDWLAYKDKMKIDFYLPDYNIAIECQGEQHFRPVDFSGNMTDDEAKCSYLNIIERDKTKYNLCNNNGIKILYYSFSNISLPETYYNKIYINFDVFYDDIYLLYLKK